MQRALLLLTFIFSLTLAAKAEITISYRTSYPFWDQSGQAAKDKFFLYQIDVDDDGYLSVSRQKRHFWSNKNPPELKPVFFAALSDLGQAHYTQIIRPLDLVSLQSQPNPNDCLSGGPREDKWDHLSLRNVIGYHKKPDLDQKTTMLPIYKMRLVLTLQFCASHNDTSGLVRPISDQDFQKAMEIRNDLNQALSEIVNYLWKYDPRIRPSASTSN